MIAVLDYGMGNTSSMLNMLKKIGCDVTITLDQSIISQATGIILPGVGAFANGMSKLHAADIVPLLCERVLRDKVPFLGVCLGMQLLFDYSEEGGKNGLSWLAGTVKKFNFGAQLLQENNRLKVPHMGWNEVKICENQSNLFKDLPASRFYFVHSYHVVDVAEENILATCHYGYDFACAVKQENIYGVQFHPEKSHRFGLQLLKNFVEATLC